MSGKQVLHYDRDGLRHIRAGSGIFLCLFKAPTRQHLDEDALPPTVPTCLWCMSKWVRLQDLDGPPDYAENAQRGYQGDPCRGAAMGRPGTCGRPDYAGSLLLRRVRLDSGGYDPTGAYFGHGDPLYWYASNDRTIDGVLRAGSRAEARKRVLGTYPRARVRR